MSKAPDYVKEYIQEARNIFGLNGPEWHFTILMTDRPGGRGNSDGWCLSDGVYMNADIEIREGIEDRELIRNHVFHEVLHAVHAEIDSVVEQMEDLIPKRERKVIRETYEKALERFVQRTARSVCYAVAPREAEESEEECSGAIVVAEQN